MIFHRAKDLIVKQAKDGKNNIPAVSPLSVNSHIQPVLVFQFLLLRPQAQAS